MKLRVSIAGLLVAVSVCAIGFAALRNPSRVWVVTVFTLTVALLLSSIVFSRWGRRRAFWFGFALFGWGHFFLSFGTWGVVKVDESLPAALFVEMTYARVHPNPAAGDPWPEEDDNVLLPPIADLGDKVFGSSSNPSEVGGSPNSRVEVIDPFGASTARTPGSYIYVNITGRYKRFQRIAYGLACLVIGGAGGILAALVESRRRPRPAAGGAS